MAGFTLNWQDFMKRPEIKVLLEEKGMTAVKQKYAQEQSLLMWNDPLIINEAVSPGVAVSNNNSSAGGSSQFITGNTAHASIFTWGSDLTGNFTASCNFGIGVHTISDGKTFNAGHQDKRHKILLAFVTGSTLADLGGLSSDGFDVVVTASIGGAAELGGGSGSWANIMKDNVAGQTATAVVGGFTNTIAPSTLINTITTASNGTTFTISHAAAGGVDNAVVYNLSSDTGSIAVSTKGTDTFFNEQGVQIFDGSKLPYANMPRK